jgi:predicted phage terminase large subunit-like protein
VDALLDSVADRLEHGPGDSIREQARQRAAARFTSVGLLARTLDRRTVQTDALDLLDEHLEAVRTGALDRLIWTMPPQEGKSQRISRAFPLWLLIHNPELRIGIVSYEADIARRWGRAIRNDIRAHPELGLAVREDTSAAHEWQLDDGHDGGVVTTGIGGALTGRPIDILIIDDPVKGRAEADSETYRQAAWDWWLESGSTRLGPLSSVVLLMTRWHESDLAGRLLDPEYNESAADWTLINIPALADHRPEAGETDPLGREPGQWLASARRRTKAMWERIRRQAGTRAFLALYQGKPAPDSGSVWKREWWRRYSAPIWSQHPERPDAYWIDECDEVLISADMAFKDTKGSDYVAIGVWARRGAMIYLVDQIVKRLSFTETLAAFQGVCRRWPQATGKLVEDKANGTAVIDSLKKKIPGIIAINPTESKYARAQAVAPIVEAGNVHLPDGRIALFDVDRFIAEAASFPQASHDDQVDQTSQALARLMLRIGQGSAFLGAMKAKAEADGVEVPASARTWRDRVPPKTDDTTRAGGAREGQPRRTPLLPQGRGRGADRPPLQRPF